MNPNFLRKLRLNFNVLCGMLAESQRRKLHINVELISGKLLYYIRPVAGRFIDKYGANPQDRYYWDFDDPRYLINVGDGGDSKLDLSGENPDGVTLTEKFLNLISNEARTLTRDNHVRKLEEDETRRIDEMAETIYQSKLLNVSPDFRTPELAASS